MKWLIIIIVLLISTLTLRAYSEERVFDYRITNYPNTKDDCDRVARDLGDKITQAIGVKIDSVHAQEIVRNRSCNITVSYFASERFAVESTYLTPAGSLSPVPQGMYRSLSACEGDLRRQKSLFEEATGLKAAIAFCFEDQSVFNFGGAEMPYILRMDGFGRAPVHPFNLTIDLQSPFDRENELVQQVYEHLVVRGVKVAQVTIRWGMIHVAPSLNIHYYASDPLAIETWAVWLGSDALCQSLIPSVRTWFTEMGEPALTTFCSKRGAGFYAGLWAVRLRSPSSVSETASKQYSTYEKCWDARAEVLTRIKEKRKWSPVGALCGIGWDGVEMTILGKK